MKMIELRRERRPDRLLTPPGNINFCSAKSFKKNKNNSFRWSVALFDLDYTYSYIYQYRTHVGREETIRRWRKKGNEWFMLAESRVVFQSLFPIRRVINILMRLPFGRVAGKRSEISSQNRDLNNYVTRRRALLLIHSTTGSWNRHRGNEETVFG